MSGKVLFAWDPGVHATVDLSRQPTIEWTGRTVEGTGSAVVDGEPLAPGTWWWRVKSEISLRTSSAWMFHVRSATSRVVQHGMLIGADVNGDGFDDIMLRQAVYLGRAKLANLHEIVPLTVDKATSCNPISGDRFHQGRCSGLDRPVPAGDLNGDGFEDVVMPYGPGGVFYYLGGSPLPSPWAAAGRICPDPNGCRGGHSVVRVGDVNGDGYGDLAVSMNRDIGERTRFGIFLGGPRGPTALPATVLPEYADLAAGGDLDQDGFDDLAALDCSGRLSVYLGSSNGVRGNTPSMSVPIEAPCNPDGKYIVPHMRIADIDNDGFADVIGVSGAGLPRLWMLSGQSVAAGKPVIRSLAWTFRDCCNPTFAWTPLISGTPSRTTLIIADAASTSRDLLSVGYDSRTGFLFPPRPKRVTESGVTDRRLEAAGDVNGDGFDDLVEIVHLAVDQSAVYRLVLGSSRPMSVRPEYYEWVQAADGEMIPSETSGPAGPRTPERP